MTCMFTLEELEAGALFVPSWLESNSRVRNVVMKSLNSKRRRIRSDKAKNALTENISVISMFGEPMDDPFLKGLFDEHERDSLLDPFDQIKVRELAQLVHTQIGRICLDEEDSKAPKSRKRTGEDVNEKMEKCTLGGSSASGQSSSLKSFGSRKGVQYTFFPCVFQALLRKIKQNLIKELDRPFLKDLLVAFGRILELLPPTNRINRESWMRLFTGTPTEPYDSSKGYEWTTMMQETLLTFLESKDFPTIAEFIIHVFEIDLAAQYIKQSNRDKEFRSDKGVRAPKKSKQSAKESDFITIFTNAPKAKEDEVHSDTDDLGFNNAIPSFFPMALIAFRPRGEARTRKKENEFLKKICKGFFKDTEAFCPTRKLYGRLLQVCMEAMATYGLKKLEKVASTRPNPIRKFDDIDKSNQPIMRQYVDVIKDHMKTCRKGTRHVDDYFNLGWLRTELIGEEKYE